MIQLEAFGSFDLHDDGESLQAVLAQPKRAALLAYLVLARPGAFHRRDALLTVFWPESNQSRGRNALSQSLTFLRRELPEGVLLTRGTEEVGAAAGRIHCDVVDFEAAVTQGRWVDAVELYRGPLLEGLHVSGAPAFMEWLDHERERLRALAGDAGWRWAHEQIMAGALRLVPTDESRVRAFIQALASAGDRAAALRFYGKFTAVLREELDVEPAPETVEVAEAVRARTEPAEGLRTVSTDGVAATQWEGGTGGPWVPQWAPAPEEARRPEPGVFSRKRIWRGVVVLAVLGLVVFLGYGLVRSRWTGGPGTLIGAGRAAKYDQVLVADFENASDPGLGQMVAEWLRVELDQSDIVRPVNPVEIGEALRRMERDSSLVVDAQTAREIGVRDGYPLIIVGAVRQVGAGYLLTARLEATTGEVLGRFRMAAESDVKMVEALERMGEQIRSRMGESLHSIEQSPPLEQVSTSSLNALRLYTEAVRLADRESRPLAAQVLLERAIALDTTFAMAYLKLNGILNSLLTHWERQPELSRRAYQYRDRLTEYQRLLVEGSYVFDRMVSGVDTAVPQPDECDLYEPLFHLYDAYIRRHPDDPRPLQNFGYYQDRIGRSREAMATYRKLIAMEPSDPGGYNDLVIDQLAFGQYEEARETIDLWRQRLGASASLILARISLAARRGDYAAADSLMGAYQARHGPDPDASVAEAQLDAVRGRMKEAGGHYTDAVRRTEQAGDFGRPVVWVANRALTRLVAVGDTAEATLKVEAALDRVPDDVQIAGTWINVGLVHALAGDAAGARQAVDTLTTIGRGNWSLTRGVLAAAIALAERQPERSLELLASSEIRCTFNTAADLRVDPRWRRILAGRAHEMLNESDAAIREYEAYFTDPAVSYPVALDAVFRFDTLERLGALYEAHGDSAKAASYYARAAELWKDTDPELQPRVARLRQRAAALGAPDLAG
ncbi:MAG: BTAD domain-containing putative transcriptional regulator [Gemmatimonadota bacterium]